MPNARSLHGDASTSAMEIEIEQAKSFFLFHSFPEPVLKLFLARLKDVVKRRGEKKYLVTENEQQLPFSPEAMGLQAIKRANEAHRSYATYTIYEVTP